MEVIIHGKPNAGSSKSTFPSDALSQRIVDEFFNRRDDFVDQEALIVDVRSWKGVWYSVYTYRLSNLKELSESVGRSTYFAISLIIQDGYCCLVSEVLSLLKKVYEEAIIGTYISNQGKYIVQNLDDSIAFDRVVKNIKDNYTNLVEIFDDKFVPQTEFRNDNRYSILDCDSKAFVQRLRTVGRIIVSDTEQAKDDKLQNVDKHINLYKKAQLELAEKDSKIVFFKGKIKELENALSEASSSTRGRIKKLEEEMAILSEKNQVLQTEIIRITSSYNAACDKLGKVAELLGCTGNFYNQEEKNGGTNDTSYKDYFNGRKTIIPFINTFLILGLIIVLAFDFKESTKNDETILISEINRLTDVLEEKNDLLEEKDEKIQSLSKNLEEFKSLNKELIAEAPSIFRNSQRPSTPPQTAMSMDENCDIVIYQDNRPVKASEVDISKPIMIVIGKIIDGYSFHSHNLKNPEILKAQKTLGEIILQPENKNKAITITYRSDDRNKLNEKNKMVFNSK